MAVCRMRASERDSELHKFGSAIGPGALVAAAFIGPGTVTTCTLAGMQTGYDLLWALAFATLATVILQEMAVRLGFITSAGLGEAIRRQFPAGWQHYLALSLVLGAILIGNAAYQAGNLGGAVLGWSALVGPSRWWPPLAGGVAFTLLWFGRYEWLERLLVATVLLMSACFLVTVMLVGVDWPALLRGLVPGAAAVEHRLLAMGLIGTTVVPYNLFLHASAVARKKSPATRLADFRWDSVLAIVLGGITSGLIVLAAAPLRGRMADVETAADLARQWEPLLGPAARTSMGCGLLAAGVSSALTAPMAAAYAAAGMWGWSRDETSPRFRAVWIAIVVVGTIVASLGYRPVLLIAAVQVLNGILLPLVAGFLLWLTNRPAIMGDQVNRPWQNGLGLTAVLLTLLLGLLSLARVVTRWWPFPI